MARLTDFHRQHTAKNSHLHALWLCNATTIQFRVPNFEIAKLKEKSTNSKIPKTKVVEEL
jgi:hypothetical protein